MYLYQILILIIALSTIIVFATVGTLLLIVYTSICLRCSMGKHTTWSKCSICTFFHKNCLHTLNDHHLKYKGYLQAIYRDITS